MEDLAICKQLLDGNHLSDTELERAAKIVWLFKSEIKRRIKYEVAEDE